MDLAQVTCSCRSAVQRRLPPRARPPSAPAAPGPGQLTFGGPRVSLGNQGAHTESDHVLSRGRMRAVGLLDTVLERPAGFLSALEVL